MERAKQRETKNRQVGRCRSKQKLKNEKKKKKENERKKQQTKCAAVVYMAAVLWLPDSKLCLPLLLVCVYISCNREETFRSCEGHPY